MIMKHFQVLGTVNWNSWASPYHQTFTNTKTIPQNFPISRLVLNSHMQKRVFFVFLLLSHTLIIGWVKNLKTNGKKRRWNIKELPYIYLNVHLNEGVLLLVMKWSRYRTTTVQTVASYWQSSNREKERSWYAHLKGYLVLVHGHRCWMTKVCRVIIVALFNKI